MNSRHCATCGKPVPRTLRSDAKYCSPLCRGRAPSKISARRRYVRDNISDLKALQRGYTKTPQGKLMMTYHNMRGRAQGIQKKKAHLYDGLPLLPREEFYEWSRNNAAFWRLFRAWEASGFQRALSPSVNRIDPDRGYEIGNIEWVTHGVNSALARHPSTEAIQASLRKVKANVA